MNKKDYANELKKFKEYKTDKVMQQFEDIIKDIEIPEKLYRYRPLNIYTISEIINEHVFLSDTKIDDLFDSQIIYSGDKVRGILAAYYYAKTGMRMEEKCHKNQQIFENFFETANAFLRENIKIACLTENKRNIPMWHYYADEHKGICIEYTMKKEIIEKMVNEQDNIYFLPVIYTKESNDYFIDPYSGEEGAAAMALMSSILKTEDWSFEKEWRFVAFEKVKAQKDSYIDLEISAIYFGLETPKKTKNVIKEILQKLGKQIPLYEMKKKLTGLEYRMYDHFCECEDKQTTKKVVDME